MLDLFRYGDDDGDELILRESHLHPGSMMFHVDRDGIRQSARVPRDTALKLYAALGEWLYPVHTPEWENRSLIEQMIERAVKNQVAAVLPLHLAPIAEFVGRQAAWTGAVCTRDESCDVADPEPGDVGHPRPAAEHRPQDCPGAGACPEAQPEPEPQHGRLMSELPRRTRPRPICVSCGHGWGEHTSGVCWGTDPVNPGECNGCRCTRERPGTIYAPCTCEMDHSHRPVDRPGSPATCAYRNCECRYRGAP